MLLASLVDQTRTKIDRVKKCGEKFRSIKNIYDKFSSEFSSESKESAYLWNENKAWYFSLFW